MITPEYLNRIMYRVEDSVYELNETIIRRAIKRIVATFSEGGNNLLIPSTKADLRRLMRSGLMYEDIQKAIEKALPSMKKEIKKAFLESADEICKQNDDIARKIVELPGTASVEVPRYEQVGIIREASQLSLTPYEIRLLEQAYKRTIGEVANYTRTTARTFNDDFINAVNEAYMKAQSGISVQTAVTDAIKKVASSGVETVSFGNRKERIEVAIARAVRTGINQANGEIVLQRCAEMGIPYIKVSAHLGARVTEKNDYTNHSWWQGRVYSVDWADDRMNQFKPTIEDEKGRFRWLMAMREEMKKQKGAKYPDFVQTCGYGDIQGIGGANCRHTFYPFYPGIQIDDDDRPDLEENKKRYELDQKQRSMEREIRKTKRLYDSFKEQKALFPEEYRFYQQRLHKQSDAYMDFCKENGLKPRNMALKIS